MTYSKLIATAALAALPLAANAQNPSSPFVEVLPGERGYVFIDTTSSRSNAEDRTDRVRPDPRVVTGERGLVFERQPSTLSRAEVLAELRAAQQLGLIARGEADVPISTMEQEARIARAGEAAATTQARGAGDGEG